jgi:nitrate reductase gamma subunit
MRGLYALFFVGLLIVLALVGTQSLGLYYIFGIVIPYVAFFGFIAGIVYKLMKWAASAVPYRIPTTCGQEKTLPWIKPNNLESPHNLMGVLGRMLLEVLLFRSLFRNTKTEIQNGNYTYGGNKWLWLGGLAFHYTFLVIFIRHFRFFTEPVPMFVHIVQIMDSLIEVHFLVPDLYLSDVIFVAAITYLFLRRVVNQQVRFISLVADYFPLFLILSIATTGILMRYVPAFKVHILDIKTLITSLIVFSPVLPKSLGTIFYIHLFLVSSLLLYFPLSKLMHMGGVFLSPTRNLINNSREKIHINPWNYDVKTHTYAEYEDDFRDKMKAAGLPLDKE